MKDMTEELLYKASNLVQRYDSGFTLSVPNLEIRKGSITGFAGPNGSGKSTLLRILSFLENPAEGTISYNGFPVLDISSMRKRVTFLMQDPYLLKRSVFENIAYGLRKRGVKTDLRNDVFEAMQGVALDPEKYARRKWYQLSGGEAQRVALAARLAIKPEVLVLDEPVSSNDTASAEHIREVIRNIREQFGTTILLTSHDMIWLSKISDEIMRLNEGMIIAAGTENVIPGPWQAGENNLWYRQFRDGIKIYSTKPPRHTSTAILEPSDIMISAKKPVSLSAHNIIRGAISTMSRDKISGKVRITVDMGNMELDAHVTDDSVIKMSLIPGKMIWLIFKASSLRWN